MRSKCRYCKASIEAQDWKTDDEKTCCLSCTATRHLLHVTAAAIMQTGVAGKGKVSKLYWAKKLHDITDLPYDK